MSTFDKVVEVLAEAKDLEAEKITMESTWDDIKTVGDVVKAIDAAK